MGRRQSATGKLESSRGLAAAALAMGINAAGAAHAGEPENVRFQLTDLNLRDPHVYTEFLGCRDITDALLFDFSINAMLQAGIEADGDDDGYLDQSYVIEFSPLDQSAPTNPMAFGHAMCTAPLGASICTALVSAELAPAALDLEPTCLEPLAGTVRPYSPVVVASPSPCFVSSEGTLTLDLAGIPLTLVDAQISATFADAPATSLTNGLIRGFISETQADNTIVPVSIAVIGGQPLSALLPGGDGNCAAASDKDLNGDEVGWWLYFNFPAQRLEAPPDHFFADGFETLGE